MLRTCTLGVLITCLLSLGGALPVPEPAGATFPGANGKIAFSRLVPGSPGIFTINPDGSGSTKLYSNSASGPAWSPDGLRIAFSAGIPGYFDLYVMNADGSEPTRLTDNPLSDVWPAWSPDGSKIAFSSDQDGNWEIYVVNADGSGQTNLTNSPTRGEMSPDWSPDGSKLVFSGCAPDFNDICVMNPDGSGVTNLTNSPLDYEAMPSWSPDGSKIVLYSESQGHYGNLEIYVMNADGSGLTRLTNQASLDAYPAWSPDGAKIAFVSRRDGNEEIYIMNADGSQQTRVTSTNTDLEAAPAWQPLIDTDGDGLNDYEEVYVVGTDREDPDTDEDGCGDGVEVASASEVGGGRDPLSFWDFFDTPDAANVRDRAVSVNDLARIVARFGSTGGPAIDPLSPPPASGYHPAFDRSPPPAGHDAWDAGPPNGAIAIADIALAVLQFGHTCA